MKNAFRNVSVLEALSSKASLAPWTQKMSELVCSEHLIPTCYPKGGIIKVRKENEMAQATQLGI